MVYLIVVVSFQYLLLLLPLLFCYHLVFFCPVDFCYLLLHLSERTSSMIFSVPLVPAAAGLSSSTPVAEFYVFRHLQSLSFLSMRHHLDATPFWCTCNRGLLLCFQDYFIVNEIPVDRATGTWIKHWLGYGVVVSQSLVASVLRRIHGLVSVLKKASRKLHCWI